MLLNIFARWNAIKNQRIIRRLKHRTPAFTGLAFVLVLAVLTSFH
jgi:hypothetical protein